MNQPLRHPGLVRGLTPVVCLSVVLMFLGGIRGLTYATAAQAKPAPSEEGAQVLTRGPVHEAFAESVTFDPQPGVVVPKAPPEAIEEMPPDRRPDGDNVTWIPGYWAWDDERDDFLWLSGIWREIPPGRQWVSGYWREAGDGYQWVSGYWANAAQEEVEFVPQAPPATLEAGPNVPAPSPDQTWIPGCWTWRQAHYMWRPGYWTVPQPGWIWVPAYYVWGPGGYVLVGGYWDYPVVRRGVLFAPVYFTAGYYSTPGYFYTPATVINLAVFSDHLFLRPRYCHYYFGDYYAANYVGMGFYPWFSVNIRQGYDPIFAHQRWHHRNDHDWQRRMEASYQHRREHEDARPPRTWTAAMAQGDKGGKPGLGGDKSGVVAVSLDQVGRNKDVPVKLKSIDKQERDKLAAHSKEIEQFRKQRKDLEAKAKSAEGDKPAKVKLPTSPFVTRGGGQQAKDKTPLVKQEPPSPGLRDQKGRGPGSGRVQTPQQATSPPSTTGPTPGTSDKGQASKIVKPGGDRPKEGRPGQSSQPPGGQAQGAPGTQTQQGNPDTLRRGRSQRQGSPPGNQPPQPSKTQAGPGTQQRITPPKQSQQPQMRRQQLGSQQPQQQRSVQQSTPSQRRASGGPPQGGPSQRQFGAGPSGSQGPRQAPQMRQAPKVERQAPQQQGSRGDKPGQPKDKPKKDPREDR